MRFWPYPCFPRSAHPPFPPFFCPLSPTPGPLLNEMQCELHVADWTVLLPTPKDSPRDHIVKMENRALFSHESQEPFKKCPAGEKGHWNLVGGVQVTGHSGQHQHRLRHSDLRLTFPSLLSLPLRVRSLKSWAGSSGCSCWSAQSYLMSMSASLASFKSQSESCVFRFLKWNCVSKRISQLWKRTKNQFSFK